MTSRDFTPRQLDVVAFANAGASLAGELPLADLPRVADEAPSEAAIAQAQPLRWHAEGRTHTQQGGNVEIWLHLTLDATIPVVCQRCLGPMMQGVSLHREFRFVDDESIAEALDIDADEDILAISSRFDLIELLEDEILLALPVVPKHDHCPDSPAITAWMATDGDDAARAPQPTAPEPAKRQPFAALAAFKRQPTGEDSDD